MTGDSPADEGFTILFVCTGNVCRSALAERLARAYLDEALAACPGSVVTSSAGVAARVASAMHPYSAAVLRGLGGDPAGFSGRQLTTEAIEDADLTLTMTREQVRQTLGLAPRALKRTFTLREAAGLLPSVEPAAFEVPDLRKRLVSVVARMSDLRWSRQRGVDDDVPDPINGPIEDHQRAGALIADALIPLLDGLVAPPRGGLTRPGASAPGDGPGGAGAGGPGDLSTPRRPGSRHRTSARGS